MKIGIIGAGYVGLVTGTCFSELGNEVIIHDIDKNKIALLNQGKIPIYEPGLSQMIINNVKDKRLFFTDDLKKMIESCKIIFIAVSTPPKNNGSADLTNVLVVAKEIGANIKEYKVIVNKSTVPVGTAEKVKQTIKDNLNLKIDFDVISNPEFLREGSAIQDFMVPDRIVVGTDSQKAKELMQELYSGIARDYLPIIFTDIKSSEIIKYASNAMLAARISFMNQLAPLCEKVGADIKEVAKGIGMDKRIGSSFLQAGIGYGGSCFPKDVQALAFTLKEEGIDSSLIEAIEKINNNQKRSLTKKIKEQLGNDLKGKHISLWGLAFKPKTDDIREAPSITIIEQLKEEGANISVFDPEGMENMKKIFPNITYSEDMYSCIKDSDCLILVTEWDEFRTADWDKIKKLMKNTLLIDGRNIYDPAKKKQLGFKYIGVGRA